MKRYKAIIMTINKQFFAFIVKAHSEFEAKAKIANYTDCKIITMQEEEGSKVKKI